MNKRKIINDPIYGFISLPTDLIFDIIQHPWFQRLRRIKQLGFTSMVYPGAEHSRFQHTLGALHLMTRALDVLTLKGVKLTPEEKEAAMIAIVLHDMGHGPFSHTLEYSLVKGIKHENLSYLMMQEFNKIFNGKLTLAIKIFEDKYKKHFLHQLVSSQLDVDRLDYLTRDSFHTGVQEGVIGYDRIIEMLNVHKNTLVVEEKGIYSIEKFLLSRRLMYWQVYLHKTSLSAEMMILLLFKRAKHLSKKKSLEDLCQSELNYFLKNEVTFDDFKKDLSILERFVQMDDSDIYHAIKTWQYSEDRILSFLSRGLLNRNLHKVIFASYKESREVYEGKKNSLMKRFKLDQSEITYLISKGQAMNHAYEIGKDRILIKYKDGSIRDVSEVTDVPNVKSLEQKVKKNFVCFPTNFR